ncbi:penicillin acylase family protein [Sediminibacterium ginsengisoli]|uniref:Acyl-homoserine lactone (AHL) acylase PvdQ n=1 Tax=Sediminibacterium ginsengisoli TaxID=413434 RepID=A0A1T4MAS2_9BACT|nr:penicillin acylase family protein [Sediminibacterium ginsengisoli]SJZ63794.1 Acyl-homoserine lactone (AHL) acylase PvdQ [Sediminibacterium ginsengisoli]
MKQLLLFLLVPAACFSQRFSAQEISRWESRAKNVNIIRDTWGIPHIYGKKDADAVFGLLYAQCEENFERVERNYLEVLGRQAEADGESRIFGDLQMRLIEDSADAIKDYHAAAPWFRELLDAFADGINYYLYKHPQVKPAVLQRFEPWFHLMFTDGSVSATRTGGVSLEEVRDFYGRNQKGGVTTMAQPQQPKDVELRGSNGFAIAPSRTASKNAILYINPHVPFYFRSEIHMVSEEGLNAYGAVTWGQMFVYQGFNEHCGWMHTTSYADVADLYEEKVSGEGSNRVYEYEKEKRPVTSKEIVIHYKKDGKQLSIPFKGYYTHHGPVMANRNGKWLSLRENNRSLNALVQSWISTKANGLDEFKKAMELRSNTTNNTVYADDKGNIAYWHGDFVPKRDPALDWTLPVDGSIAATEWQGVHALDEIVHLYNPASGWIQNCNSTPFTAAGASSPDKNKYPVYMAPDGQNARGLNAARLLENATQLNLDRIIAIGYNRYMAAFDILLPPLLKAYDAASGEQKSKLTEAIEILRSWNRTADTNSIATTVAVDWATRLSLLMPRAKTQEEGSNAVGRFNDLVANTTDAQKLDALTVALQDLEKKYGSWKQPWGAINRYQRTANDKFDDAQPSIAVALASSRWGTLPAFESRSGSDTRKRYGTSGNSFIAAVEFGKKLKAKTIVTGGQSRDPLSPHFTDQANGFINGQFKEIFFYKEDVLKNMERQYRPGQ